MTQNEAIQIAVEQLGILAGMLGDDYEDQAKLAQSIARLLKTTLKNGAAA